MKMTDFNGQKDDRAVWAKIQALLETDPDMDGETQSPGAVHDELKIECVDIKMLFQRIESLLGHPIPDKAILYVTDFHLMASSTDPLEPWFEYQWGLDGTLHLKLMFDPSEGTAALKQKFKGKTYDATLHWDSSQQEGLAFDKKGNCKISPDQTQRLAIALKLPRVYHHWGHNEEVPTVPVLRDKLTAMAQGIRVFLNQAQGELLAALRNASKSVYDSLSLELEPVVAGSVRRTRKLVDRGDQQADQVSKLPEVLLTPQLLQPNELVLWVDWGGVIPASPPPVEVELNDTPIQVQTVWRDGLKELAVQAEGLGQQPLELGWHWRLSDHRLGLFLRTGA